jgi:hypothetical protein
MNRLMPVRKNFGGNGVARRYRLRAVPVMVFVVYAELR